MARGSALRRPTKLWRQIDAISRWIFPVVTLLFGLFVIGMPFGIPGQAALRPVYAMACVYFWSLYRPGSLPAPLVALCGLLLDLLGLSSFGVWAVLLLLLQWGTLLARRKLVPARFLIVWASFTLAAGVCAGLAWAIESALALRLLPPGPLVLEVLLAAGLYPLLAAFLIRAHRGPAAVEQA
ncbi:MULTISPECIES: rod shape-determining protein MreD [Acidocella]|uniref:rod shape-determining protein MreD n=1 Tax=Acidocella TaxID=50709 RepID=UPI00028ECAAE|nr:MULTISPECIES: rod shape-determining protein MreD [Acidocella]EKM99623.1 rod shape-determining protein mreD [Acidocella sp. MX-AZ02]WBO58237.1 rod shape-determining protein MreD [Acidocella sp. MX-AZ03]